MLTGFDHHGQKEIKPSLPSSAWLQDWADHAKAQVPRKPRIALSHIPRDNTGLPIFPQVDLKSGGFSQYVQIITDYLTELWGMSNCYTR